MMKRSNLNLNGIFAFYGIIILMPEILMGSNYSCIVHYL